MILFNLSPKDSIYDLMIEPDVTLSTISSRTFTFDDSTTLCDFCEILDKLFGIGFSLIVRRPISKLWWLWLTQYRYYKCKAIKTPSAKDYLTLYKFLNVTAVNLSKSAELVMFNAYDGKIFLQNAIKSL